MTGHYDEATLQEYLDSPEDFAGREALERHVALCAACRDILDELRAFEAALASNAVWQLADSLASPEPPPLIRELAELLAREDREAAEMLAPLVASPASFRRAHVSAQPTMRTAGVVRRLCDESRALRERQPMHALVVADAAIAIADQLLTDRYPPPLIDELRGGAWLERANVLRYLGRHAEAFDALDISERVYARSPVSVYSIAVVDYVRAVVSVESERLDDALRLARRSARVFRQFGEDERYVHAKMVEATVLFDQHRHAAARELFLSLAAVARSLGKPDTLARLYANVANCDLQLQDLASAEVYFARALSLYEALGLETERIRARWNIGCLRIAAGDVTDGVARLREARREFEELGARSDAALVALDLAEALLAGGDARDAAEAQALCTAALESFNAVGMTGHALAALAYLREAFDRGRATPALVRHVRQYLASAPDEHGKPFLPPPS
ncbi:MAG TPA: tetratricopeptide repeat protein [Thermoanaerobaculia bacterium]